jgi:hypothetical protein
MKSISAGCYFAIHSKPQNIASIIRKCDKLEIEIKTMYNYKAYIRNQVKSRLNGGGR